MSVRTRSWKFKKGQKLHLDQIYSIQGVGDHFENCGQWWDHAPPEENCDESEGDNIVVTKTVEITIKVKCP